MENICFQLPGSIPENKADVTGPTRSKKPLQ